MSKKAVRHSFFSGVIILAVANIVVKIIGMIYKIPLTNMLGDEGMGYFNTAYQIYSWLYMLSTAGLPVAMSLMISECNAAGRHSEKKRILQLLLGLFTAVGLIGSLVMIIFCRGLSSFISADKAYLCILAVAPAFFFICISSTLRGYFQGHGDMLPTAVSEILEAVGKMSLGILLGAYALNKGLPLYQVAAYSITGVSVGVAAGALFLLLAKLWGRESAAALSTAVSPEDVFQVRSTKSLLGAFLTIAIPVMLSSSLLGMSSMLDTLIVIRRLGHTGINDEAAIAMYGNYTAYCVTLFNLPPVLIYPIVNALLPAVSAARTEKNNGRAKQLVHTSLRLSAVISLPCAFGLAALSEPVLKLIFANEASAEMAAPLLTFLAPSVFLIGLTAVSNGILQAYGLQRFTLISMLIGACVKGLGDFLLVPVAVGGEPLRMLAAPISTFLFYLTITVINCFFIIRKTDIRISVTAIYLKPFISAALCAVCAVGSFLLLKEPLSYKGATVTAILAAAMIYLFTLLLLGAVTEEDLKAVAGGQKLSAIMKKLRLLPQRDEKSSIGKSQNASEHPSSESDA